MNTRTAIAFAALIAAALGVSRSAIAADTYKIDPAHTSIVFSVGHAGLSYTYGFFKQAGGTYTIDKTTPANSRFELVIQADSLDTNNAKRDEHLRGPEFFNTRQFPEIRFETTACNYTETAERGGIRRVYELTGDLTMHGVTRPIKFPLELLAEGLGPYKDQRTGFLCQLSLKRSDFDMDYLVKENLVGDAVSITISFEGFIEGTGQTPARTR
jgi:polyisoprenoid-binding protein YceI